MRELTKKYCVGCGLCQALSKAELCVNEKGFSYPTSGDSEWLDSVCPIGNLPLEEYDSANIWGRYKSVFLGWSNNNKLRNQASSGGILSEVAIYLLKKGVVDGVIHIQADQFDQAKNNTTISCSAEEVLKKCGSRYSISHPLDILGNLDFTKKYAFIGRPCDVVALRNLQKVVPTIKQSIPLMLSFFCMGMPSDDAQEKLLSALGSTRDECQKLTYRGNGWPGYAAVENRDGSKNQMDYDSSWGKILGRDLMPACRFCLDGIGEAADISCGDAWYMSEGGKPDFSEHEGRNVVFARTSAGEKILKAMLDENRVTLEEVISLDEYLSKVQASQFFRRASMGSRIAALCIMRKPYPKYSVDMMKEYSKRISAKEKVKVFLGTVKRIKKGVI